MKVRWYHWMVYKLFHKVWTPIFVSNPAIAEQYIDYFQSWLEDRKASRAKLTIVKR